MVYIQQSKLIRAYQEGINDSAYAVSKTNSLKLVLRILCKTIKFWSEINRCLEKETYIGLSNLSIQIISSNELLTSIQSVNLIQELTCPDTKGVYFFYKTSWQKSANRVFLLFKSILLNITFAEKLKFIDLGKITKIAIGKLPVFKFTTGILSIGSCFFLSLESIRTKQWIKVMTAAGKIFVTTLTLLLEALSIQQSFCVLALTGISCSIDIISLMNLESAVSTASRV